MANRECEFASNLRAFRALRDLSQAELAERAGVDVTSIQKWENGAYMPSLSNTVKLADALGVNMDALAGRVSLLDAH